MRIATTRAAVRAARQDFVTLGLVPTMGFLHEGHLSLVRRAKAECGAAAVSIFVNPTQFAPAEDFSRYPRDEARDLALLRAAGTDLVFLPDVTEIYPDGFAMRIEPGPVGSVLEGQSRPGHFAGVATVVAKLFNLVQPDRAYFGQKDGQQCAVIRQLARDLDFSLQIVVGETVREPDGLALSSRNVYLTAAERAAAPVLFRALGAARTLFRAGECRAAALRACMATRIAAEPLAALHYVSIADADTLTELEVVEPGAMAAVAARFGATRLIDNVIL